jgi:GNAT superfamily N-acetyltransferase
MDLQARTLFVHNERDRLLVTNEPNGVRAPRVFVGRTAGGDVVRFRADVPTALKGELAGLAEHLPPFRFGPSSGEFNAIIEALARYSAVGTVFEGPAFRFPEELEMPQGLLRITPENVGILPEHFDLTEEISARQPCFAGLVDGEVVALSYTSRLSERAAEVGANTDEAYRGRGLAAALVTAWAVETRAQGRIPLYSTWWENRESLALARKLGLLAYGVDFHAG